MFRAAFHASSKTARLWSISDIRLVTSVFAVEEAYRNLPAYEQHRRLARLLDPMEVRDDELPALPEWIALHEKDQHILQGAIAAGASYLLTEDQRHFGQYFWQIIEGITILPVAPYLRSRAL